MAVFAGSVVPGMIGTPAARIRSRAAILEPMASIAGWWADPDEPRRMTWCELGILREKPVVSDPRRLCAESAARRCDLLEGTTSWRPWADEIGLVSACDMKPPTIGFEYTATVPISSSRSVLKILTAISPRLATRTLENSVMGRVFFSNGEPP